MRCISIRVMVWRRHHVSRLRVEHKKEGAWLYVYYSIKHQERVRPPAPDAEGGLGRGWAAHLL